jgi:HD-like signal output (HDOD) protein
MNTLLQRPAPARVAPAELGEFTTAIRRLPLFPGVAVQLIGSVEREDISARELSDLISRDAALSVHLLRLVNSSFYGLSRRIGTVDDALAVLGFNLVRRVVTSMVMQRPLATLLPDTAATRAFWQHQLLSAVLARHLHRVRGEEGEELAYMAGLLHDIGRLAMLAHWPEGYRALLTASADDADTAGADAGICRDERRVFGFDHALAGGVLLAAWDVPEPIAMAAEMHVDAAEPTPPVAASVWRANRLAHRMAHEPDTGQPTPWMEAAGLDPAARRRIEGEVLGLAGARA